VVRRGDVERGAEGESPSPWVVVARDRGRSFSLNWD
jgi:hypothetical protein